MQPKFITFIHCTFGKDEWEHAAASQTGTWEDAALRNMVIFRSAVDNANVNLIDMNLKEVRLWFQRDAFVGVWNGVLYFHADKVLDTKIRESPSEYGNPDPERYSNE